MTTEAIIKDIQEFIKPPKDYYENKNADGSIWNVKISNDPEQGFEYCNYEINDLKQASEIWNKMSAQKDFIKDNIDPKDLNKEEQLYYIVENFYSKNIREKGIQLPDKILIK